jgi:hypothetical protein
MSFFSWLRNRASGHAPRGGPQRRCATPLFRPRVEALEDRTLLASYSAANVSELIADINAANKAGGASTITLTAPATSPYILTAVNNTANGANGLPVIGSSKGVSLTIIGNGDIIERSTAAGTPAFRLFDVAGGNSLTLENLTLQNGLAQGAGATADGGAIYNQGSLTLTGATVQSNTAQGSNGINGVVTNKLTGRQNLNGQAGADAAGGGIWSSGSVTLQGGATLQGNQARGGAGGAAGNVGSTYGNGGAGGGGFGGGLYEAGGSVSASNATVSGNYARGGAGGGPQTAPTIAVSSPPTNTTGIGGKGSGGGMYVADGALGMSSCIVQSNQAQGGAGGHFYYYAAIAEPGGEGSGGGIYVANGTVNLDTVSLSSNNAYGGASGNDANDLLLVDSSYDYGYGGNALGGGLYVGGGSVILTGGTATNNGAWGGGSNGSYVLSAGSPGVGEGGGIFNSGGTVTVSNSTVSSNVASAEYGGGIYNAAAGTLFVINQSTVTNNGDDLYNLGTASISGSTVGVTGP